MRKGISELPVARVGNELRENKRMDIVERKLLIEQTQRELCDSLKQYLLGLCHNGEIIVTKTSGELNGFLFVIPEDKYRELFGGE